MEIGLITHKISLMEENQKSSEELIQKSISVQTLQTVQTELYSVLNVNTQQKMVMICGEHMYEYHSERYQKSLIVTIVMLASIL
jgi:hypothetical protein